MNNGKQTLRANGQLKPETSSADLNFIIFFFEPQLPR